MTRLCLHRHALFFEHCTTAELLHLFVGFTSVCLGFVEPSFGVGKLSLLTGWKSRAHIFAM